MRDGRGAGKPMPLRAPRPPPKKKMQKAAPSSPGSQAHAAAAGQRARAETHGTPRARCTTSSRSDASKNTTAAECEETRKPRKGRTLPDPLQFPGGERLLTGCTDAEISPSAITLALDVNPRAGHGIGFLSGCVGSEDEVPDSVTEPSDKGLDSRQPVIARRLAPESCTVPAPLFPDHHPESTTESSLENPPATCK